MKIANLQRGDPAPLVHHLWPLTTYSSPSRSMRDSMLVASELATPGSVIAKQERISPSSSGSSHSRLLVGRPELGQDLHVAGVGRGAVGRLGSDEAASHDLRQRRVLEVREAGAEPLVRQEEVPQVQLARLDLQILDDRRMEEHVAGSSYCC